jgi:hypothetical protein
MGQPFGVSVESHPASLRSLNGASLGRLLLASTITVLLLMEPRGIILHEPFFFYILLEFIQRSVHFLPKGYCIKLILNRLVKPFEQQHGRRHNFGCQDLKLRLLLMGLLLMQQISIILPTVTVINTTTNTVMNFRGCSPSYSSWIWSIRSCFLVFHTISDEWECTTKSCWVSHTDQ